MENIPVMKKMSIEDCCGCEVCARSCPFDAIQMLPNEEGFLYPDLDSSRCRNCGKCIRKCPVLNIERLAGDKQYYAGFAKDDNIVRSSSSGGMWTLIAEGFLIEHSDGIVVGSIWSDDFTKVQYSYTSSIKELEKYRRSKYSQSFKGNIYDEIEKYLVDGKWVLFTGTPCEVAGLRSYLGKDYVTLITVDLICQGPESPLAMKQFMEKLISKYKSKISSVSLREVGGQSWIPQWIRVRFENGKEYYKPFYCTELGESLHTMQRKSCYKCKYVLDGHCSDITIGDYHGANPESSFYNPMGVSILVTNSVNGNEILNRYVIPRSVLEPVELDELGKTNPRLIGAWNHSSDRKKYVDVFKEKGVFSAAWSVWGIKRTVYYKTTGILKKIIGRLFF